MTTYNVNIAPLGISFYNLTPTLSGQYNMQFSCNNTAQTAQSIKCLFPSSQIAHRNISSVANISFPYERLNLENSTTNIRFPVDVLNNVSGVAFNKNFSVIFSLNATASWELNNNALLDYQISSPVAFDLTGMNLVIPNITCIQLTVRDSIYSVGIDYSALFSMQIQSQNQILSGSALLSSAQHIISSAQTYTNSAEFNATGSIMANVIVTEITSIAMLNCGEDVIPTAAPLPPVIFAVERYTISDGGLELLGLTSAQSKFVFNYDDIDKYGTLVTGDGCFKFFFLIPIPIPFIPFLILIPVWPDVSTLEGAVDFLTTTLSDALKGVEDLENIVSTIESQVTFTNALALVLRAVAVSKAILSGKLNKQIIAAAKKQIEAEAATVKAQATLVKDLTTGNLNDITAITNFIQKLSAFSISAYSLLSNANQFAGKSSSGTLTEADFIQATAAVNNTGFAAIDLLEALPPGINSISTTTLEEDRTKISSIKTATDSLIHSIFELKDGVISGSIVGPQFLTTAGDIMNAATSLYTAIQGSPNVAQADTVIAQESDLEAAGAAEQKTALEIQVEQTAQDLAAALDKANAAMNNFNIQKKMMQIAQNKLNSGIDAASSALLSLDKAYSSSIEGAKRGKANDIINQHLDRDLYKISRTGFFDPRTTEAQLVVNDLHGVRIFSKEGELLLSKSDFCNLPFTIAPVSYANGCGPGADHCGGSYSCAGYDYWFQGLHYWVSFNFYDNPNLAFGGVRIGDFDGDGVDDLWCAYPGSTKNYNPTTANQIIFSPLRSNYTSQDTCDYLTTLQIPGWCISGIIKVGDFNGDKQSDPLCVVYDSTNNLFNFYLLYGQSGTFSSASIDPSGKLSQTASWSKTDNIVIGDFDGDGYSDILAFRSVGFDILYGSINLFVTKDTYTSSWLSANSAGAAVCYNTDINYILVGDLNNDKKSDIVCITATRNATIYSNVVVSTNERSFKSQAVDVINVTALVTPVISKITLITENVNLQKITDNTNIISKVDINTYTHKNMIGGNQVLLADFYNDLETKAINDIYFPHSYLSLDNFNVETRFVLSTTLTIPGSIFGDENNQERIVDLDASAYWVNQNLVKIDSLILNSFAYNLKSTPGNCLNSTLVSKYIAITVPYDATVRMYIETNETIKLGQDLMKSAQAVLPIVQLDESGEFTTFQISGHLNLNIQGAGYEELSHC